MKSYGTAHQPKRKKNPQERVNPVKKSECQNCSKGQIPWEYGAFCHFIFPYGMLVESEQLIIKSI